MLNIRSIDGKFEEVMHDFDIDFNTYSFFSMCETCLRHDTEALYSIDNYTSFYNNFRTSRGGGVAVYVLERFASSKLSSLCYMEDYLESVFVEFSIDSVYYVVGCIYRPPNSDAVIFLQEMESILVYLPTNYSRSQIILSSDFNIDLMHLNDRNVSNSLLSINESFNL